MVPFWDVRGLSGRTRWQPSDTNIESAPQALSVTLGQHSVPYCWLHGYDIWGHSGVAL